MCPSQRSSWATNRPRPKSSRASRARKRRIAKVEWIQTQPVEFRRCFDIHFDNTKKVLVLDWLVVSNEFGFILSLSWEDGPSWLSYYCILLWPGRYGWILKGHHMSFFPSFHQILRAPTTWLILKWWTSSNMVPQIYPPSSNPRASDLGQRCTVHSAQRLKSRKTKLHRLSVHLSEPFGPCDIIVRTHNQWWLIH